MIEINPNKTLLSPKADIIFRAKASKVFPMLLKEVRKLRSFGHYVRTLRSEITQPVDHGKPTAAPDEDQPQGAQPSTRSQGSEAKQAKPGKRSQSKQGKQ